MKLESVYITGANGFIGRRVVERLCSEYCVVALLRPGSIPGFTINRNVKVVYGDLTNYDSMIMTLPQQSIIINLAANPYHPKLSYEVNVNGTKNLMNAAKQKNAKLIIHISSQATKIKKQGVYAKTKNASDEIVRKTKLPFIILKPSLVYGGGERGLFSKIKQLAKMLPMVPVFGDGQTKVYPIYVDDFAEIVVRAIREPRLYQREFDVGTENPITYNILYDALAPKTIHIPVWIGLLIAWMCHFLPNPPIYRDNVLGSTQSTRCNPTTILRLLKFHPRSFAEGIKEINGDNKLRIAVIGLGKMGTLHLSILNTFDNVKVVALIDTNKQLFSTVKSMGIPGNFYSTLSEAKKREVIDAVYILTPTFTHFELLKEALKYRLHVFLEKPAFLNLSQLEKAKTIRTKQIVHVGYTLLYSRIYRELKKIIDSREYGDVVSFSGKFEHAEVFGPKKGWMFNKNLAGGGVLMNPGPHFFSLLMLFFGKPNKVEGKIKCKYVPGLDDEVDVKLDYGKFQGSVKLSWSVKKRVVPLNYFEINLEKALLETDGQTIRVKTNDGRIKKINEADVTTSESTFNINPIANGEAYFLENKAFIEAIAGNKDKVMNTLKFAMDSESSIFEVYKHD